MSLPSSRGIRTGSSILLGNPYFPVLLFREKTISAWRPLEEWIVMNLIIRSGRSEKRISEELSEMPGFQLNPSSEIILAS